MSRSETISRRFRTVGTTGLALLVVTLLLPVLLAAAAIYDFGRWVVRRQHWVAIRLVPLAWLYLFAEIIGILLLFLVWLASMGGLVRPVLLSGTYAAQRWWASTLFASIRRLFRLSLEVEGGDVVSPGPVLIFMRHASIIDNLLPNALISSPHRMKLKYVLKRELLSDPALDVAGSRLPNYFVDRASANSAAEAAAIGDLAFGLAPDEGVLIYPEGTRFTSERRSRALERLAEADPDLHKRGLRWNSVLPPRVGGPLALLEACDADVVIAAHSGLGGFSHIRNILDGGLIGTTIRVRLQRFSREGIPGDREGRAVWLFDRWGEIDAWISS